jgi:hypothetical protein
MQHGSLLMLALRSFTVAITALFCLAAFSQPSENQIRAAIRSAGGPAPLLQEIARQSAQTLPTKINANVEMQSVAANGLQLMYTTRLLNVEKANVSDVEALRRGNINYSACNSPTLGFLIREQQVRVSYIVLARGTEFLFQYDLDRLTCRGR